MYDSETGGRWCHALWSTGPQIDLIKIVGAPRICERGLSTCCAQLNWTLDTLAITRDRIQILLFVSGRYRREDVVRALMGAATQSLRRQVAVRTPRLWSSWHWCAFIPNLVAVRAVRDYIRRLGVERGLNRWYGGHSVGEEPTGRVYNVRSLRKDEILERWRIRERGIMSRDPEDRGV